MAQGLREGLREGLRWGLREGLAADVLDNIQGPGCLAVTWDATSGIYVPASGSEWTTVLTTANIASGNPFAGWTFQEPAAPFADFIGSFPLTLTTGSSAAPTFQAPVSGWSRGGVQLADNATTSIFNNSANLNDVSGSSIMVVAYRSLTTAAARGIIAVGTSNRARLELAAAPAIAAFTPSSSVSGSGSLLSAVRPLVLQFNRTATTFNVCSDTEFLTPTWDGTVAGKFIAFGNSAKQCAAGTLLYAAAFSGSAAELSQNQLRNLLQVLGWRVTW